MFQTYMRRECTCHVTVLIHKRLCFEKAWDGAQLSNGTSTSNVCMFQTYVTIECNRHAALLLHIAIRFKMTLRLSAAVRWHFYFTSLYVSIRHHTWVHVSYATSTSQVCMFQTYITHACSCPMALLLHKCVCTKQTSRVRATVRWHFYFTSVFVSKWHRAWVQLSDGTSYSQFCMC